MNFLAHLFLARHRPEDEQLGNFAADHAGSRLVVAAYGPGFRAGVALHQRIDSFTDQHPIVHQTKARLRAAGVGKYAPVVADVLYDHLLARDFDRYSPRESLGDFTQRIYGLLTRRAADLPPAVQQFLPLMVRHDWLANYAHPWGLERSLSSLARRASAGERLPAVVAELARHDAAYAADFAQFFPELQAAVAMGGA
jgi:acyl carrier protein phosphodiesterase